MDKNLDALATDVPPLLDQINLAVTQIAQTTPDDPRAAELDQSVKDATAKIKAALAPAQAAQSAPTPAPSAPAQSVPPATPVSS